MVSTKYEIVKLLFRLIQGKTDKRAVRKIDRLRNKALPFFRDKIFGTVIGSFVEESEIEIRIRKDLLEDFVAFLRDDGPPGIVTHQDPS